MKKDAIVLIAHETAGNVIKIVTGPYTVKLWSPGSHVKRETCIVLTK